MAKVRLPDTELHARLSDYLRDIRVPEDFRVRRTETPDFVHLNPQQIFDALPEVVRDRVELDDFRVILMTTQRFWYEYQCRAVDGDFAKGLADIERVVRD